MPNISIPEILLDALASDPVPQDLWQVATSYLADIGFDRVIHLTMHQNRRTPEIRSTMPEQFLRIYNAEGYAKDDPFLTYCLHTRDSIPTGVAYLDDYDYLTARAAELIEVAASEGFNAGYSVSLAASGLSSLEGWNIGSSLSRKEVEAIRKHRHGEIRLLLAALRGRLSTVRDSLTMCETEAMQLLIEGKRTKEIAACMGVSGVTAEFHLTNARRKLGAATREAAVARFLR